MDVSTFYALFSATCFALLGFWWQLLQGNPHWLRDPATRRAVGGVYLAFLLPALMGLFAQVGETGTTAVWRTSFVVIAAVGVVATLRALAVSGSGGAPDTANRVTAVVLYALVVVIGVAPEVADVVNLRAIQAEAIVLILLVVLAHGLVWQFMTHEPTEGRHEGRDLK